MATNGHLLTEVFSFVVLVSRAKVRMCEVSVSMVCDDVAPVH